LDNVDVLSYILVYKRKYIQLGLKSNDNFIDIYMYTAIFSKTVIYSIREENITLNILYVYIYYIYKPASQNVAKYTY